jgi:tetratricopeptide (TPR) repeat protein
LVALTDVAPKFAQGFYYLGLTYAASGESQEAIDQLHTAAKLAPKEPHTYLLLATIEVKQANYGAALDDSERALQYDPNSVPALSLKAEALFALGRDQEAEQVFQNLAKLAPQNSVVHQRLGQLAVRRKDLKTAAREFESALRLDPSRAQPLNDLALVLSKTAGTRAALKRIRAQIELRPDNADFHTVLAVFLLNNHQPDAAVPELKTAIAKDPNAARLYYLMTEVYQAMGKTAEAQAELKASLVKQPNYAPALMVLGAMADRAGGRDEAIGYYQRLLAFTPNFAPAANNLAYDYLLESKNLDQALELAQHARQLLPHDPEVADTLGEAFLKRGLPDNAVPLFRESLHANAKDAGPHYHLGFALLSLKQDTEARAELNTALKLGPDAREAGEARKDLAQMTEGEAKVDK